MTKAKEAERVKRYLKGLMSCGMAVMVLAGIVSFAHATGTVNWKTTVYNNSDRSFDIYLSYGAAGNSVKWGDGIPPGGSYIFETGRQCPTGLSTGSSADKETVLVSRCLPGGEHGEGCWTPVCKSTSWQINKHMSDGKYHFDKL